MSPSGAGAETVGQTGSLAGEDKRERAPHFYIARQAGARVPSPRLPSHGLVGQACRRQRRVPPFGGSRRFAICGRGVARVAGAVLPVGERRGSAHEKALAAEACEGC